MKRIKRTSMILLIILLVGLTACTQPAPIQPEATNPEPTVEEPTEPAQPVEEETSQEAPEITTVTFGRNKDLQIVNQFLTAIGGGQFEIRKILFDRSVYQPNVERTNLQLSMHGYSYDEDAQTLEIEYRIANPSELWLYSYRDASMHLSSILETEEGQQALSLDYGYPQTVLPPHSYLYFTHRFEDIHTPAIAFTVRAMNDEFHVELDESEILPATTFTADAKRETSLDYSEFYSKIQQIENQSWDLIPFKHLKDAKISEIAWAESDGTITLTITPDAFVPLLSLAKEHYRFQVVTDAGEVIPAEIESIDGQIDEGRYVPREPVTITLKTSQSILDPCTAIQLHMVYAIPTQEDRTIYLEDGSQAIREYDNMDEISYFSDFLNLGTDVKRQSILPVETVFYLETMELTEMRMKSALINELLPFLQTENLSVSKADQLTTFEILEETIHSPEEREYKIHVVFTDDNDEAIYDHTFAILYLFGDSEWQIEQIEFAE